VIAQKETIDHVRKVEATEIVDLSRGTCHSNLRGDLNMYCTYGHFVPCNLSVNQLEEQCLISRDMIDRISRPLGVLNGHCGQ
jgi:hypothetical protein